MDVVGNIFKLFLNWIKLRSLYAVRLVEGMTVSGIVTFLIELDQDMLFPGGILSQRLESSGGRVLLFSLRRDRGP